MSERNWNEALLVAYVDGELPEDEARRVAALVETDPEARETVRLLTLSAEAARNAFDKPLRQPIPDRLMRALDAASEGVGPAKSPTSARRWSLPLAAAIAALVLGFGGGYLTGAADDDYQLASGAPPEPATMSDGRFEAALFQALQVEPGAEIVYGAADGDEGTVTAREEIALSNGLSCRAFENQESMQAESVPGIACRGADGAWAVLTLPGEEDE